MSCRRLCAISAVFVFFAIVVQGQIFGQPLNQLMENNPFVNRYQNGMSANLFLNERECVSNDGLVGTCINSAQCTLRGGKNIGSCSGLFKVCCQETRTCNQDVKRNNTYFVQPPNQQAQGTQCALRVPKLSAGVCQLRLEFAQFSLRGPDPVTTKCDRDKFIVSGQDFNSIVPSVCGENKGQHMYMDVASVRGPIQLIMTTSDKDSEITMNRQWSIRITQIPCTSSTRAPQGCLQYYTGSATQNIQSFNYGNTRLDEDSYPGGLDYTICIRKELGLCTAAFESVGKFGVNTADTEPSMIGVQSCPNDHLLIGETRYCGGKELPKPPNTPGVADEAPRTIGTGPLMVHFVSGTTARTPPDTSRPGFNIRYRQESCHVK